MRILILIITIVIYIIIMFIHTKKTNFQIAENHNLEIIWTFLPGIILIIIAFPSLQLLYISEENEISPINLKIIGHQWYWSYEYSNFKDLEFDSFIIRDINNNTLRLLETDNILTLPEKIYSQLFVSSTDVLHSWTIPSLGVKIDSTPGRLNIVNMFRNKRGNYFGQCSEICGANHSFIPISLNIIPFNIFKTWLKNIISLKS